MEAGARRVYLIEERPGRGRWAPGLDIAGAGGQHGGGHWRRHHGRGGAQPMNACGSRPTSTEAAGDALDEAIMQLCPGALARGWFWADQTAEEVKMAIGCVYPQAGRRR